MKKDKSVKLTPEQFHKWKASIFEMQKAELTQRVSALELKLMQKEAESFSLRAQLHSMKNVADANELVTKTKDEYNTIKKELEETLGISLNNKAINEATFEINDLK